MKMKFKLKEFNWYCYENIIVHLPSSILLIKLHQAHYSLNNVSSILRNIENTSPNLPASSRFSRFFERNEKRKKEKKKAMYTETRRCTVHRR